MTQIAIVFHSGDGHTARVAEHVAKGARGAGATVELLAIDADGNLPEAAWARLKAADAIAFGSPISMGSVSRQFKRGSPTPPASPGTRWTGRARSRPASPIPRR